MELCHARYEFEHISYIHSWLQHALSVCASRTSEENIRLLDDLRFGFILAAVFCQAC